MWYAANCNIVAIGSVHVLQKNMDYFDHAKKILSKNGYKLTGPRILVLEAVSGADSAQNAYEIKEFLDRSGKKINIVSVYRILSLLKAFELVHEISDGKFISCKKFDCEDPAHCHHQFLCSVCGKIEEMHVDDTSFVNEIVSLFPKLSINSHTFRFEGLCENCKKLFPKDHLKNTLTTAK